MQASWLGVDFGAQFDRAWTNVDICYTSKEDFIASNRFDTEALLVQSFAGTRFSSLYRFAPNIWVLRKR